MQHRLYTALVVVFSAGAFNTDMQAATIEVERTFSYSHSTHSHQEYMNYQFTLVVDHYNVDALAVVLAADTYDLFQLTLSPGAGLRLEVDSTIYGANAELIPDFYWTQPPLGGGVSSGDHTVSYVDGTGDLPTPQGGAYGLSTDGSWINAQGGFTGGNQSFGFASITIEQAVPDVNASGVFDPINSGLTVYSMIPGHVADQGRFSFIVPEPASVALLGLGGFVLLRRRV